MRILYVLSSIIDKNPMDYIARNEVTDEVLFQQYAASLFGILQPIGVGLIVFSCIYVAIRYSINPRQDRKNLLVGPLMVRFVIASLLGGFVYVVGLIYHIIDLLAATLVH